MKFEKTCFNEFGKLNKIQFKKISNRIDPGSDLLVVLRRQSSALNGRDSSAPTAASTLTVPAQIA